MRSGAFVFCPCPTSPLWQRSEAPSGGWLPLEGAAEGDDEPLPRCFRRVPDGPRASLLTAHNTWSTRGFPAETPAPGLTCHVSPFVIDTAHNVLTVKKARALSSAGPLMSRSRRRPTRVLIHRSRPRSERASGAFCERSSSSGEPLPPSREACQCPMKSRSSVKARSGASAVTPCPHSGNRSKRTRCAGRAATRSS